MAARSPSPRSLNISEKVQEQRWELLARVERWLEPPMTLLAFVWLALFIVDVSYGSSPLVNRATDAIWLAFLFDFGLKLILAPKKWTYLRSNLLTAVALVLPALRIFRVARVLRILRVSRGIRSVRLLRFFTSLNRGMRALSKTLGRKGFGYVVILTVIAIFAGAAGMYAFESDAAKPALMNYWSFVWWTAMTITTMGTDYFPKTAEGRFLCFILALYGFAVFGYITATVASFFVDQDSDRRQSVPNDRHEQLAEILTQLNELKTKLESMDRDKAA